VFHDLPAFAEDAGESFENLEARADEDPGNGPTEGDDGNDKDQELSEEDPGKIQDDHEKGSVVQIGPELVTLRANTVAAVFDFLYGGIDLVIDDGLGSVYAAPALDDAT